jgi:hypothetical protein
MELKMSKIKQKIKYRKDDIIYRGKKCKVVLGPIICEIKEKPIKIIGIITATIRDGKTGKIKRVYRQKNLIATIGRAVLAQRLANITTYTGVINYGALGTSVTPPANGDTQLGAEVYRKTVASNSAVDNVATIAFFYNTTETSGSYKEFGTFIDGTASANSGKLFSHVAVDWSKTTSETLTVECQYTVA